MADETEQKDGELMRLSQISKETGIPLSTLSYWARNKKMKAEQKADSVLGLLWYTTVEDAQIAKVSQTHGRPKKK